VTIFHRSEYKVWECTSSRNRHHRCTSIMYMHMNVSICIHVCACTQTCANICTNVHTCIYRVSQEERTKLWEGVPYVKVYRYNPKHLYSKLYGYGDNGKRSLKLLTAVTHLLIAKFILKLAGICGFCNVNICT